MDDKSTIKDEIRNIVYDGSILERYKSIVDNEETVDGAKQTDTLSEEVRKIKESPLDIRNKWVTESSKYEGVKVSELSLKEEPVTTVLRHAYCPNCGEEIQTKEFPKVLPSPNQRRLQKKVHYRCPNCGEEMWLDRMYPCFVKVNSSNEEVTGYNFGNEITLWS